MKNYAYRILLFFVLCESIYAVSERDLLYHPASIIFDRSECQGLDFSLRFAIRAGDLGGFKRALTDAGQTKVTALSHSYEALYEKNIDTLFAAFFQFISTGDMRIHFQRTLQEFRSGVLHKAANITENDINTNNSGDAGNILLQRVPASGPVDSSSKVIDVTALHTGAAYTQESVKNRNGSSSSQPMHLNQEQEYSQTVPNFSTLQKIALSIGGSGLMLYIVSRVYRWMYGKDKAVSAHKHANQEEYKRN